MPLTVFSKITGMSHTVASQNDEQLGQVENDKIPAIQPTHNRNKIFRDF